jgi:uncharacterized membrane protein YkoI
MNPIRKAIVGAALVGTTLVGGAAGAALINGAAGAEDATTTTTAPAASGTATTAAATTADPGTATRPAFDPAKGGHVGANGTKEELLTGDTAEKVKAAALAAVPGGTVERVETDAEGAAYEAHMRTSDGSEVTVKLDSAFKVTSTEDGHR